MLTVISCSHNGAGHLPKMLDSFCRLRPPRGGWKMVFVDNASTDGTGDLVRSYADRLPLKVVEEPARGVSRAKNRGVEEMEEGDLVVFTDDDTIVCPDWLIAMREAADRHSDHDIFGGLIRPLWPSEPPEWIHRLVPLGVTYAVTPDYVEEGPVSPGLVWGPSMAFRRRVFDAGHRFDPAVGPQPGNYRMGAETEFTERLGRLGYKAWFVPRAEVQHIIRPNQMDPNWIVRRAYRFGRDIYWKEREKADNAGGAVSAQLLGMSRWRWRKLVEESLRWAVGRVTFNFDRRFAAAWEIQFLLGYLSEARAARKAEVSGAVRRMVRP